MTGLSWLGLQQQWCNGQLSSIFKILKNRKFEKWNDRSELSMCAITVKHQSGVLCTLKVLEKVALQSGCVKAQTLVVLWQSGTMPIKIS